MYYLLGTIRPNWRTWFGRNFQTPRSPTIHHHQSRVCVAENIWDTIAIPPFTVHLFSSPPRIAVNYYGHSEHFLSFFIQTDAEKLLFFSLRNQLRSTTDGDKTALPRGIEKKRTVVVVFFMEKYLNGKIIWCENPFRSLKDEWNMNALWIKKCVRKQVDLQTIEEKCKRRNLGIPNRSWAKVWFTLSQLN